MSGYYHVYSTSADIFRCYFFKLLLLSMSFNVTQIPIAYSYCYCYHNSHYQYHYYHYQYHKSSYYHYNYYYHKYYCISSFSVFYFVYHMKYDFWLGFLIFHFLLLFKMLWAKFPPTPDSPWDRPTLLSGVGDLVSDGCSPVLIIIIIPFIIIAKSPTLLSMDRMHPHLSGKTYFQYFLNSTLLKSTI